MMNLSFSTNVLLPNAEDKMKTLIQFEALKTFGQFRRTSSEQSLPEETQVLLILCWPLLSAGGHLVRLYFWLYWPMLTYWLNLMRLKDSGEAAEIPSADCSFAVHLQCLTGQCFSAALSIEIPIYFPKKSISINAFLECCVLNLCLCRGVYSV